MAKNNTHLLTCNSAGQKASTCVWVLCLGSPKAVSVSARLRLCLEALGKIHFQARSWYWQNSVPVVEGLRFRFFGLVPMRHNSQFLEAFYILCHGATFILEPVMAHQISSCFESLTARSKCKGSPWLDLVHVDDLPLKFNWFGTLIYICKALYHIN